MCTKLADRSNTRETYNEILTNTPVVIYISIALLDLSLNWWWYKFNIQDLLVSNFSGRFEHPLEVYTL